MAEQCSLNTFAARAHETAVGNGWWIEPVNVPEKLALIHSEVSEALEEWRVGHDRKLAEELADVLIRTLDLMAYLRIDADAELVSKMVANRTRAWRHGGKRC